MRKVKKSLAVILSLLMVMLVFPFSVSAADTVSLLGDVDFDGMLTTMDSWLIYRMSVGLEAVDDSQAIVADVDANGRVSASDARLCTRMLAGLSPVVEITTDIPVVSFEPAYQIERGRIITEVINNGDEYTLNISLSDSASFCNGEFVVEYSNCVSAKNIKQNLSNVLFGAVCEKKNSITYFTNAYDYEAISGKDVLSITFERNSDVGIAEFTIKCKAYFDEGRYGSFEKRISIAPENTDLYFAIEPVAETDEVFVLVEQSIKSDSVVEAEVVEVYDITLNNSEGVATQPDGTIMVNLPFAGNADACYEVYRVNDDGTLTDMNASFSDGYMVFTTDHFSIYVIVKQETKDAPSEPELPENNCTHICHKSGFIGFIWKLINFFQKLFGIAPVCECGSAHY